MLRSFAQSPGSKVVYIAPLKALARERIKDWTSTGAFSETLNKNVVELTGETTIDSTEIEKTDILITTPEKFDGISRQWRSRAYVQQISLVVIDEIHLLGTERGAILEVIVSRLRILSQFTSRNIRIVGLSTALANAHDLASWLGIERIGLFNFPSSVRPVPLRIHISGYPGKAYCPRMAGMNKPTYGAIMQHSHQKPVMVFVSSRRQTRLTALDLIAFSAADGNARKWLSMSEDELESVQMTTKDEHLKNMMSFGIGE